MSIKTQRLIISPEILSLIAEIDEFKGAWRALGKLAPEQLSSLKRVATIETIGASTRIEGSKLTDKEVEILLSNPEIQKFKTRDEQEVVGYSAVMKLIFECYPDNPLSEKFIQQLHAVLLEHSEKDDWQSGNCKGSPNHGEAFDALGKNLSVVLETKSPFKTSISMGDLVEWAAEAYAEKKLHPLLITPIVIVAFLAIHPFQNGNESLSRALTTYLLLREGYNYIPYSSLEEIIEQNKESYCLALSQTHETLKNENPNWQPWILFFLRTMQEHKKRLEIKVEQENLLLMQLPELSLKIVQFVKSKGKATISDIVFATFSNRNTIKKHLGTLVDTKRLQKNGVGKGTWYCV